MKITSNQTIGQIQDEFSSKFPMLKIEFYTAKHGVSEGSKESERITDNSAKLEDLNPSILHGTLALKEEMRVSELESAFEDKFGLHIQVFRKSGDQWIQTSVTDNWTLAKQEQKGEDLDQFLATAK